LWGGGGGKKKRNHYFVQGSLKKPKIKLRKQKEILNLKGHKSLHRTTSENNENHKRRKGDGELNDQVRAKYVKG